MIPTLTLVIHLKNVPLNLGPLRHNQVIEANDFPVDGAPWIRTPEANDL